MKKAVLCLGVVLLLHGASAQTNTPPSAVDIVKEQNLAFVQDLPMAASPSVFVGNKFPAIDFVSKVLVQRALGNYRLTVRFFGADWQEVLQPVADGRYGAWVTIHFENGITGVRHLTLFRVADDYSAAKNPYHATLQFPKAFLFPPGLSKSESWNVDQFVNNTMNDENVFGDDEAAFLAAMHDIATDPARYRGYECLRIDNMWWQELEKRQGWEVPYQKTVLMPEGYQSAPDKKWPLIIFLHGSGDRGDDLAKLKGEGPAGYSESGHPLLFIIVSPLCPKHERWNPGLLMNMVEELEKTYRIDPSRIYLTGLSMGGSGALATAAAYPGKFAALASLSGRENPEIASRIRTIPTWFFHGEEDDANPAHYTVELVNALKALKAPVKLTLIPGEGHGGWDKVYANPDLYSWFLEQHL